jgi:hypothetical protein
MAVTTKECCIPYCEISCSMEDGSFEDTFGHEKRAAKLIPICSAPHYIHMACLQGILKHQKTPKCPICRDDHLSELKEMLTETPYQPPEEPSLAEILNVVNDNDYTLFSSLPVSESMTGSPFFDVLMLSMIQQNHSIAQSTRQDTLSTQTPWSEDGNGLYFFFNYGEGRRGEREGEGERPDKNSFFSH